AAPEPPERARRRSVRRNYFEEPFGSGPAVLCLERSPTISGHRETQDWPELLARRTGPDRRWARRLSADYSLDRPRSRTKRQQPRKDSHTGRPPNHFVGRFASLASV